MVGEAILSVSLRQINRSSSRWVAGIKYWYCHCSEVTFVLRLAYRVMWYEHLQLFVLNVIDIVACNSRLTFGFHLRPKAVLPTSVWCKISNQWIWCLVDRTSLWQLKNKKPARCHLLYLLYFLDTQHVSGINMSIFKSLRLCCWNTTLAGIPDTILAKPHPNSNTQQSKNNTANVVVQQHSRKLLKMDILMPETCWVTKK